MLESATDLPNPADHSCSDLVYSADGHVRKLWEIEGDVLRVALILYQGHMTTVARQLGIGRSTLYRKLWEHRIEGYRGLLE